MHGISRCSISGPAALTKVNALVELILASSSESRRRLLQQAGIPARVVAPQVDEQNINAVEPAELALLRAELKANDVARLHPDHLVLGADQVVFDGHEVFGKPANPADHIARLRSMRGRSHQLITGYCLIGPKVRRTGTEITHLTVRKDLHDEEIAAYVRSGEGSKCAGGYAAEGHGAWLFSTIDGDWFNVLGLPILTIIDLLREAGWSYPVTT